MSSNEKSIQSSSFEQLNPPLSDTSSSYQISSHSEAGIPLNLRVSFDNQVLNFSICCSKIQEDPFTYFRHYLLLDVNRHNLPRMLRVVQCYYEHMNVGDLLMVKSISREPLSSTKWIEKTRTKRVAADRIKIKQTYIDHSIVQALDQVFRESRKYQTSLVCMSVWLDSTPSRTLLEDIEEAISNSDHINSFNLHCLLQTYLDRSINKSIQLCKATSLKPIYVLNLQNQLSDFFENLYRTRLMRLAIKLQCLNGSFTKASQEKSGWSWEGDKLAKTIKGLKSHLVYQETIKILGKIKNTDIFIEISFVSMRGDIYKTAGCLKICQQSNGKQSQPSLTFQMPRLVNEETSVSNFNSPESQKKFTATQIFKNSKEGYVIYSKTRNLGGEV